MAMPDKLETFVVALNATMAKWDEHATTCNQCARWAASPNGAGEACGIGKELLHDILQTLT